MALIRSGIAGASGGGALNPYEYVTIGCGTNAPATKDTFTSGTAFNLSASIYCQGALICVRGLSGTIECDSNNNVYYHLIGIKADGTVNNIVPGASSGTTSMSSQSFSDYEYLIMQAGASGTNNTRITVTVS